MNLGRTIVPGHAYCSVRSCLCPVGALPRVRAMSRRVTGAVNIAGVAAGGLHRARLRGRSAGRTCCAGWAGRSSRGARRQLAARPYAEHGH